MVLLSLVGNRELNMQNLTLIKTSEILGCTSVNNKYLMLIIK